MDVLTVFAVAVGIFVIIAAFIISTIVKRTREAWSGTVTEKKIEEETRKSGEFDRKVDVYYLYVKLADGKNKKLSVGKTLWDSFKVGDEVEKKPGSFNPVKV